MGVIGEVVLVDNGLESSTSEARKVSFSLSTETFIFAHRCRRSLSVIAKLEMVHHMEPGRGFSTIRSKKNTGTVIEMRVNKMAFCLWQDIGHGHSLEKLFLSISKICFGGVSLTEWD